MRPGSRCSTGGFTVRRTWSTGPIAGWSRRSRPFAGRSRTNRCLGTSRSSSAADYLYAPVRVAGKPDTAIEVAVADTPAGPFRDVLGKPLIAPRDHAIDPTVAIDDDGQAYMYWGNPDIWYVKLNRDMMSYSGDVVKVDTKPADYQEGPSFYRRGKHYYMAYASTCCPEMAMR
ncbi:family 43 glycosylhydrolase [Sphingomonas sp. MMS24-JH45]